MNRTSARSAVLGARFGTLGPAAILVLGGCSEAGELNAEVAENSSASPWAGGNSGPTESAIPSATPTPTAAVYKPATAEGSYQLLLAIQQEAGTNRGPNGVIYGEGAGSERATAQIMRATYVSDRWVVDLVENM